LKGMCFFRVAVSLSGISLEESHVVSGDEEKACFAQLSGVLSEKSHVVTGDSEKACVTRLGRGATRLTGMLEGRRLDLERTLRLRAESECKRVSVVSSKVRDPGNSITNTCLRHYSTYPNAPRRHPSEHS
jgi:hypothetical protein